MRSGGRQSGISSMSDRIIQIIVGHGGAQKAFDMNQAVWKATTLPTMVITQECDPLDTLFPVVRGEWDGHCGRSSRGRMMAVLGYITHQSYDSAIVCEYDSFVLPHAFRSKRGFHGYIHQNNDLGRFYSPRYVGFPWMIDAQSAATMFETALMYPDLWEDGYDDRFVPALAHLSGVPMLPHDPAGFFPMDLDGYAEPTITSAHSIQVDKAMRRGCLWWHGIKDQAAYDMVVGDSI